MAQTFQHRIGAFPGYFAAMLVVWAGVLGSLFFSEIWQLAPCELCWWQRVFMYPMAVLLPIAVWVEDVKVYRYILPLGLLGFLVSIYQNWLIYQSKYLYGVSEMDVVTCGGGVSCTEQQLEFLGIINIPLMALVGFGLILVLVWWQRKCLKE